MAMATKSTCYTRGHIEIAYYDIGNDTPADENGSLLDLERNGRTKKTKSEQVKFGSYERMEDNARGLILYFVRCTSQFVLSFALKYIILFLLQTDTNVLNSHRPLLLLSRHLFRSSHFPVIYLALLTVHTQIQICFPSPFFGVPLCKQQT